MQLATLQQSRLPEAIRGIREELKRNSDSAVLWRLPGAALLRNGAVDGTPEYEEAIAAFYDSILMPTFRIPTLLKQDRASAAHRIPLERR
jgi:hypothetical protein